jgi:dCMP deaminase
MIKISKWDIRYLEMARLVSTWSKDPSTQTGAVIVRPDKSMASVGFNGFPQNMPDGEELYANRDEKYSRIVHCEMNALLFAKDESLKGYTLYTWPFISCDRCFVHMLQAGITRFVAPQATEEQLTRWGPAFDRVRGYATEANVELIEVPRSHWDVKSYQGQQ